MTTHEAFVREVLTGILSCLVTLMTDPKLRELHLAFLKELQDSHNALTKGEQDGS